MALYKRVLKIQPDFGIDKADKFKAKFVRTISGTPNVIATRKINRVQNEVSVKGMSFAIDFNKPTFRQKNTFFYFFDVDEGQLFIHSKGKIVSPPLNHLILKRSGIRQLIMGMEKRKLGEIIIYIVLAIAVGLMGGYLLGVAFPFS